MNKLNKLVDNTFPKEVSTMWMSADFQKKIKKSLKQKIEKTENPNEPKKEKQHTPYIKFCMEERQDIKQMYPQMSAKEITSKLGERWNEYKQTNPKYLQEKYGYKAKN